MNSRIGLIIFILSFSVFSLLINTLRSNNSPLRRYNILIIPILFYIIYEFMIVKNKNVK